MFWLIRLIVNRSIYKQNKKFIKKEVKQPFLRRFIAYKFGKDKQYIAHAVLSKKINLMHLEKTRSDIFTKDKYKPSFFALIMQRIGKALIENPKLNSHSYKKKLTYLNSVNVTFVVGGQKEDDPGTTRTIYNLEKKELKEIDSEIKSLVKNAQEDPLNTKEVLKIGSFGVSNFGSIGVDSGFPPQLFPYSAIMGIGSKDKNGDALFSMSFDHRWIEGHQVVKFLLDLKRMIENK